MRSPKFQLGAMMFLQYAIWGAWAPVLSAYLQNDLGFSGTQAGFIYSLLPLATIIAPFIGGQLADRYFAAERVIAALQLAGGGLLIWAAGLTDYATLGAAMLVYCLLYAPTLALTNSIAMANVASSEDEFGGVRVWGTIGWIAAGLVLAFWRNLAGDGLAMQGDMLVLGGVASIAIPTTVGFFVSELHHQRAGAFWFVLAAAVLAGSLGAWSIDEREDFENRMNLIAPDAVARIESDGS